MKDYRTRAKLLLDLWTIKFGWRMRLSDVVDQWDEDCIQRDFIMFHKDNPHIYPLLVKLGLDEKKEGADRCSMKFIFAMARQRLKYKETINSEGHKLRLSDRWSSRYARMIMNNEPELEDFFILHKLRRHYRHSDSFEETRSSYVDRSQAWQHAVDRGDA